MLDRFLNALAARLDRTPAAEVLLGYPVLVALVGAAEDCWRGR